jgi:hypothetical protein
MISTAIRDRLYTPTSSEATDFIASIGSIPDASPHDMAFRQLRHKTWKVKEIANASGIRSGWVDVIYTTMDVFGNESPLKALPISVFPTSDGDIYYSADRGLFCTKPRKGRGVVVFSSSPSYAHDVKQGSISTIDMSTSKFMSQDGAECEALVVDIKLLREVVDKGEEQRPVRFGEVDEFVKDDSTYSIRYGIYGFGCGDYAIRMRSKANEHGIKCAVVMLWLLHDKYIGAEGATWSGTHFINAFDVMGNGKIYIEPQFHHCYVDMPEIRKSYNDIIKKALSGVKSGQQAAADNEPSIITHIEYIW